MPLYNPPDTGTVTSVTAGDASIAVGGTAAAPTVETGTLDAIAAAHPPAAAWSNNGKKITGGANGTAGTDFATFGQLPSSGTPLALTAGGTGQSAASNAALLTALGAAALASPTFTGTVTAPTPVNPTDVVIKSYADAIAQGLAVKPSVQEATAAALPSNIYSNGSSGVGATLTAVLAGVLTVDGVTVALNDRVLVKNEATAANNGLYTCTLAGAAGVAYILTRATDMNTAAEIPGAFVFTEQGTANAGAGFTVASPGPFTVGTTAITFTQFSGAGEITAGTGLTKTGNTLSLTTPALPLAGGTMSGPIAMGANKITGGAAASAATDIPIYSQTAAGGAIVSGQYLCAPNVYAPGTRQALAVNSTTLAAFSSGNVCTGPFTAPASGKVLVTAHFAGNQSVSGDAVMLALAALGTVTPVIGNTATFSAVGSSADDCWTVLFYVSGLTPGNTYQFDLLGAATSTSTFTMHAQGLTSVTVGNLGAPAVMTVQAV